MQRKYVASLIDEIYPNLETSDHPTECFAEHTILSSLNADVDSLNKKALERFPGQSHIFYSIDSIPTSKQSGGVMPRNCSRRIHFFLSPLSSYLYCAFYFTPLVSIYF